MIEAKDGRLLLRAAGQMRPHRCFAPESAHHPPHGKSSVCSENQHEGLAEPTYMKATDEEPSLEVFFRKDKFLH